MFCSATSRKSWRSSKGGATQRFERARCDRNADFLVPEPAWPSGGDVRSQVLADRRGIEDRPQPHASAMETGTDGALADHELSRDLLQPEVVVVVGEHHLAIVVGQLAQRRAHVRLALRER